MKLPSVYTSSNGEHNLACCFALAPNCVTKGIAQNTKLNINKHLDSGLRCSH